MFALKFGEKLKNLRKKNGYSLTYLANMAEISKSYLWELENNNYYNPSVDILRKIADALGVTIKYLTTDEENLSSEVLKEAFFVKFNKLNEDDKKKIEQIIDVFNKHDCCDVD